MTREAFLAGALERLGPERFRFAEPLAPYTTFRVGGPADWFADVDSAEELRWLISSAASAAVPVTRLGGGSNVLVADAGVRGLVVRARLTAIAHPAPGIVRAESGVTINALVRWTIGRGLAGLEAWAGTPGTVGGAIYGNAHWGGRNIGDLVRRVGVLDHVGRMMEIDRAAMAFAYDASRLQQSGETLVWAEIEVAPGDATALREVAKASLHYRKRTQPLAQASAGCVFQNPVAGRDPIPDGVPPSAGALIDRAGLKGLRIGGARISETHANFVVNDGHATARDIRTLIEAARTAVARQFGVQLKDEIVYLGSE